MRIQQIISETGLSKRSIHHYIKKGLVTPEIDAKNGYYVFSQVDIEKLMVIRLLRGLDITVAEIRYILEHPKTANYYLNKALRELSREKSRLAWKEESIENLLDNMGQEVTFELLLSQAEKASPPPDAGSDTEPLTAIDARMLSMYFMGQFANDLEMTEYRRYLWDKLQRYLITHHNEQTLALRDYLYSLGSDDINELFAVKNQHMEYIASLTAETGRAYIEAMAKRIRLNLLDPGWVLCWKRAYEIFLRPITVFYDSPASELMRELSPRFSRYQRNVNACCAGLRSFLNTPDGLPLLKAIDMALSGYMDIDSYHNGELEGMASFQKGMY